MTTENQKVAHGLPEMATLHEGGLQKEAPGDRWESLKNPNCPKVHLKYVQPREKQH